MNANSKQPAPTNSNQWLLTATRQLQAAGIASARLDAEVLLAHALHVPRTWLRAHGDEPIETAPADSLLTKRLQRQPVAYLTGHKEFYGRRFIVTPSTLIPRPESETLIELAKALDIGGDIIDVGTGTGCLGITLALECGAAVTLSDLSSEALGVARRNAEALGAKVTFVESDLLASVDGRFDAVIANLPYVDTSWERSPETDHEPALALFASRGGLEIIYRLIDQAPTILRAGGYLLLEADPEQHTAISSYAKVRFLTVEQKEYAIVLKLRR